MEDRVAEILAQRVALDRGLSGAVAVSLVVHAAMTAAAIYAALHQEAPKTASIVNIRLAPMTQPVTARAAKAAAPLKPLQEPRPVVEQPKTKPKPLEKAPPKSVPMSPFGKSAKKG